MLMLGAPGRAGGSGQCDFQLATLDADAGIPTLDGGAPDCQTICSETLHLQNAFCEPVPGSTSEFECQPQCLGRQPEAFAVAAAPTMGVGDYLARAAQLEAASVLAFERLARELVAHDAPGALVRHARRAAVEEQRHARDTQALATARGASSLPMPAAVRTIRPLVDVLLENTVEGCVRESYGALVALWQAHAAGDVAIRQTMATIAHEEIGHAELSWAIDRWGRTRLTDEQRAALDTAKAGAVAELARACARPRPRDLVDEVGLPAADRSAFFVHALARRLWARGERRASHAALGRTLFE
jgi:hypothetical protein